MLRPVAPSARSAGASRYRYLHHQATLLSRFYWFAVPYAAIDEYDAIDWMSLIGLCELAAPRSGCRSFCDIVKGEKWVVSKNENKNVFRAAGFLFSEAGLTQM